LGFPLLAWMNSAFFRRIFARYEKKKPEEQEPEEENVQILNRLKAKIKERLDNIPNDASC